MPKLGKAHSCKMAQKFISLGWTLKHELRAADDDEPYEYIFEWEQTGEPRYPAQETPTGR